MRTSSTSYALSICAAGALLAGCGVLQPPVGAPGAMPQSHAIVGYARRSGSWMLPEAKSGDLVYVSNDTASSSVGQVLVFTYPKGKLVGRSEASLCLKASVQILMGTCL